MKSEKKVANLFQRVLSGNEAMPREEASRTAGNRYPAMAVQKHRVELDSISRNPEADLRIEAVWDILFGLLKQPKSIPSKYFYDARGSMLFERICDTPEYYLTRMELAILGRYAGHIMSFFSREGGDLVELGSGSTRKIGILLDSVSSSTLERIRYIPVDISESALDEAVQSLSRTYGDLDILGIAADFTRRLDLLPRSRKLVAFLGSTIGNFSEEESVSFLSNIAGIMSPDDRLLIGLDMLKPVEIMEAAYNDSQGLTEAFNLNILTNVNRETRADFNPEDFEHLAFFNEEKEQIEMRLRAGRPIMVFIEDLKLFVPIDKGETIRTEISRKFSRGSASALLRSAGFSITRWFTDLRGWFSLIEACITP